MKLRRPKEYHLELELFADYPSTLLALSLASLKTQPTEISPVERTPLLQQAERFFTANNVSLTWQDRSVVVRPGAQQPFTSSEPISDYDLFKCALSVAVTRGGSRIRVASELDSTAQTLVLGLRRLEAEIEFLSAKPPYVVVKSPARRPIRYHLQRENAKIVPQLVTAMTAIEGVCELFDLFAGSRFDYIFSQFLKGYTRGSLVEPKPDDELERRLLKRQPAKSEYLSRLLISGGISDEPSSVQLHPDAELAAVLVAAVMAHKKGKLTFRNYSISQIANTPVALLKRLGAEVSATASDDHCIQAQGSSIKGRTVKAEQLHDYPDAIAALALAGARSGSTLVIHSSPFTTPREESRRRSVCEAIRGLGVKIAEIDDGVVVEGQRELSNPAVSCSNDPFCTLMALASALGPVQAAEIDNLAPARDRWGSVIDQLTALLGAQAP